MQRGFGFLALIITGVWAVVMLTGSLAGSVQAVSSAANGGQSAMSPMAAGYSGLAFVMVMGLASLARFSWSELPRLVTTWARAQRQTVAMALLACIFSGVLLFY